MFVLSHVSCKYNKKNSVNILFKINNCEKSKLLSSVSLIFMTLMKYNEDIFIGKDRGEQSL